MERYSAVVQFKTSCNAFYAPIAAAMIMAGKGDEWLLTAVEEVTKKMGFYFQVQDDYLDCYGDPEETGKIGSDIENSKCTWLILKTLEVASQAQTTKLERIYFGVQNDETVQNVKDIFQEVGLPALYEDFEEEQQNAIIELIHELPNEIPKLPFRMYAAVLFGRTK